jgi:hypothetical protein
LSWAILGQASGAYVGPTCWAVFFLAAAVAVLHERDAGQAYPYAEVVPPGGSKRHPRLRLMRTASPSLPIMRPGPPQQWP